MLSLQARPLFGHIDLKKAWKAALKHAQIENCRSHDMRYTLGMLQRYTHLDVQVTKKFSKNISEQILQGVHIHLTQNFEPSVLKACLKVLKAC